MFHQLVIKLSELLTELRLFEFRVLSSVAQLSAWSVCVVRFQKIEVHVCFVAFHANLIQLERFLLSCTKQ
jgi:hypothetical protein